MNSARTPGRSTSPAYWSKLALFGAAFVGFSVIADVRSGVTERMPVNRIALLFGRVLRDVLLLVAGVIIALPAERDPCTL